MSNNFEPKITAFLCNWCSYAAADKAGNSQKSIPPNLSVIRVMCSGMVDPQFVLDAFKEGADGVMILGCHFGDCHYKEGNHKAFRRFHLLKKMLKEMGIEKERFLLEWVSASEAEKYVKTTNEMADRLKSLGPLKLNG